MIDDVSQASSGRTDLALAQSEARFAMLFEQAGVGMCFVALDGRFVQTNRRMNEIVGYRGDELLQTTCVALTNPADRAMEKAITTRLIAGEIPSQSWEKRYIRRDGSDVWCTLTLTRLDDAHGVPFQFVGIVEDISERRRASQEMERSESLLRLAGETAHLGGWSLDFTNATDFDSAILQWSDEVCAIHDVPPGSIPKLTQGIAYYVPGSLEQITAAVNDCRHFGTPYDLELEIVTATGRRRWVRSIGRAEEGGKRLYGSFQDITDRKTVETEIVRMNRALKMLSSCSDLLVRAVSEARLLEDACKLAVDLGGYSTAWVGFARNDAAKSIEVVATAGNDRGYAAAARLSWDAENSHGRGVAGRTVRGGEPVICEDIETSPEFAPWLAEARSRAYRSVIALPLRTGTETFGLLCMYSEECWRAPAAEVALLGEFAANLAFGIAHLRAQAEQRRLHEAVFKISTAVSARSSTEFFEQLALNMADALGAQGAFIARYSADDELRARTIVALCDGAIGENCDLDLRGTPCAQLRAERAFIVADRVREMFPDCEVARATNARGFVGWRLDDSAGKPLALMFVIFREPLEAFDFTASTLKIFVARAAAELERQIADERIVDQASWLDLARDAIVVTGIDGRVSFWNKSAERLYGLSTARARGANLTDLLVGDADAIGSATADVIARGFWSGEFDRSRGDGTRVRVESRWTVMRDGAGAPRSILSIDTDITQRKAAEREIEHLAFYDQLTALPNRLLLVKEMKSEFASAAGFGALLFIDLDNFKTLNDTLGHDKGDVLLQQVARRLEACVGSSDLVSRFGGDEFVILMRAFGGTRDAATSAASRTAERVLAAFGTPYVLDEYEHNSTPSIGVTIFARGDSTDELLKAADLAMYEAKAAGRNAIRFFDPQMQTAASARRALEDDIRSALRANEFSLAYQPQVDESGATIGAEALVRWTNARRGIVSPADFIPIAEESGLIVPLGRWVLRSACDLLARLAASPLTANLKLSVNVSAREFRHPEFVRNVVEALAAATADPRLLVLELTESVVVDDIENVIAKMTALRGIGVGFSLDDFGTGYSSLAYLKRLPLNELKIDQSFVRDVLVDSNDAVIARTIVALGQNLSLDVIAEGVETREQRELLASYGCRSFQGYYFSRPLGADAFVEFARARSLVHVK